MTIAAMKQALEALQYGYDAARCTAAFETIQKAEQALRAAISEQEKCEPMAWGLQMPNEKQPRQIWLVKDTAFKNAMMRWPEAYEGAYQIELYTHPAPVPAGWLRAVDEAMVSSHLGVADASDSYEVAKKKLNDLICWNVQVAADPTVNGGWQLAAGCLD